MQFNDSVYCAVRPGGAGQSNCSLVCSTVTYSVLQTVQYSTALYSAVQHSTTAVRFCTALYSPKCSRVVSPLQYSVKCCIVVFTVPWSSVQYSVKKIICGQNCTVQCTVENIYRAVQCKKTICRSRVGNMYSTAVYSIV